MKYAPQKPIKTDDEREAAYEAWINAGTMGLGLWLAGYKERLTQRRNFTVEEYGEWCAIVRSMEFNRTGENNEFCVNV